MALEKKRASRKVWIADDLDQGNEWIEVQSKIQTNFMISYSNHTHKSSPKCVPWNGKMRWQRTTEGLWRQLKTLIAKASITSRRKIWSFLVWPRRTLIPSSVKPQFNNRWLFEGTSIDFSVAECGFDLTHTTNIFKRRKNAIETGNF